MPSVGRRLHITHRTGYRYADVVDASFNEVRMTPLSSDGQLVLSHTLDVLPIAAVQTYRDYWGAHVEAFDVHVPHRILEVVAISTVDTPPMAPEAPGTTWQVVRRRRAGPTLGVPGRRPSTSTTRPRTSTEREIVEAMTASDDPRAAALIAVRRGPRPHHLHVGSDGRVHDRRRRPGPRCTASARTSRTPRCRCSARPACPARYVSGYLHTEDPAPGQTVVGESHAWVEYWDGQWHAVDPTNDRAVGSAHVIVARGRDYADVPPLKGIYAGGFSEGLGVSVEITQL